MNKIISFSIGFAGGTVFGALGLCWLIEKHSAGINWYAKGGCTACR